MEEMDAKQKANDLIAKFSQHAFYHSGNNSANIQNEREDNAKQCAYIAVNEIIDDLKHSLEISKELHPHCKGLIAGSIFFWKKVIFELDAR